MSCIQQAIKESQLLLKNVFKKLKNKISEYMETISNNDYIEFLNKTDDKYNNNYYRTIIIKPIDDKSGTYIEYSIDGNRRKHEFRIGDHAKI